MIRWEFVAESLGLASGLALVWPALRLNRNLRKARSQEQKAATGRSRAVNELRRGIARAYTDPNWSLLDELLTIAGVGLLILSSAIRLAVLWNSADERIPNMPAPRDAGSLASPAAGSSRSPG